MAGVAGFEPKTDRLIPLYTAAYSNHTPKTRQISLEYFQRFPNAQKKKLNVSYMFYLYQYYFNYPTDNLEYKN